MGLFARIAGNIGWDSGSRLRAAIARIDANFRLIEPSVTVSAAAAYQPVLGDRIVRRTSGAAQTLTIPTDATVAFPIGHQMEVEQAGAGQLSIAAAAGVTIEKLAAKSLNVSAQFGKVRLIKMAVNLWHLSGDLA